MVKTEHTARNGIIQVIGKNHDEQIFLGILYLLSKQAETSCGLFLPVPEWSPDRADVW
jgi:hypothetical protein